MIKKIKEQVSKLSKRSKIILIVVVAIAFIAAVFVIPSGEAPVEEQGAAKSVEIINVADASTNTTPLELIGSVRSKAEAELRSETQGEITAVYRSVGQSVSAGTVIAEIHNASERAAIQQAEAALDAALANLQKGTGGVRDEEQTILEANLENAKNASLSAQGSAVDTLKAAYASVDDAIENKTDVIFSNPDSINPKFNLASSESAVVIRLIQDRINIQKTIDRQQVVAPSVGNVEDLLAEIATARGELSFIQDYLNDLNTAVTGAIPTPSVSQTQIDAHLVNIGLARSSIGQSLASLTGVEDALNNTQTALLVAEQNLQQGVSGAQAEDVSALEAAVRQAQAGLSLARANFNRTRIISPINGTINSLNVRKGDFVNAFELVSVVSNNALLEVEGFITDEDRKDVRVGSSATIADNLQGVVTSVAPAVDPVTKKVQVRIGITGEVSDITHGASVRVSIDRNGEGKEVTDLERIVIPISALKVETNRVIVFSVSDGELIAHEVETGLILGDSLVIEEGLTPDMNIVFDARGLREGQTVSIKN